MNAINAMNGVSGQMPNGMLPQPQIPQNSASPAPQHASGSAAVLKGFGTQNGPNPAGPTPMNPGGNLSIAPPGGPRSNRPKDSYSTSPRNSQSAKSREQFSGSPRSRQNHRDHGHGHGRDTPNKEMVERCKRPTFDFKALSRKLKGEYEEMKQKWAQIPCSDELFKRLDKPLKEAMLMPKHKSQVLAYEKTIIDFLMREEWCYQFPRHLSSFNRLLIHRLAEMFKLDHIVHVIHDRQDRDRDVDREVHRINRSFKGKLEEDDKAVSIYKTEQTHFAPFQMCRIDVNKLAKYHANSMTEVEKQEWAEKRSRFDPSRHHQHANAYRGNYAIGQNQDRFPYGGGPRLYQQKKGKTAGHLDANASPNAQLEQDLPPQFESEGPHQPVRGLLKRENNSSDRTAHSDLSMSGGGGTDPLNDSPSHEMQQRQSFEDKKMKYSRIKEKIFAANSPHKADSPPDAQTVHPNGPPPASHSANVAVQRPTELEGQPNAQSEEMEHKVDSAPDSESAANGNGPVEHRDDVGDQKEGEPAVSSAVDVSAEPASSSRMTNKFGKMGFSLVKEKRTGNVDHNELFKKSRERLEKLRRERERSSHKDGNRKTLKASNTQKKQEEKRQKNGSNEWMMHKWGEDGVDGANNSKPDNGGFVPTPLDPANGQPPPTQVAHIIPSVCSGGSTKEGNRGKKNVDPNDHNRTTTPLINSVGTSRRINNQHDNNVYAPNAITSAVEQKIGTNNANGGATPLGSGAGANIPYGTGNPYPPLVNPYVTSTVSAATASSGTQMVTLTLPQVTQQVTSLTTTIQQLNQIINTFHGAGPLRPEQQTYLNSLVAALNLHQQQLTSLRTYQAYLTQQQGAQTPQQPPPPNAGPQKAIPPQPPQPPQPQHPPLQTHQPSHPQQPRPPQPPQPVTAGGPPPQQHPPGPQSEVMRLEQAVADNRQKMDQYNVLIQQLNQSQQITQAQHQQAQQEIQQHSVHYQQGTAQGNQQMISLALFGFNTATAKQQQLSSTLTTIRQQLNQFTHSVSVLQGRQQTLNAQLQAAKSSSSNPQGPPDRSRPQMQQNGNMLRPMGSQQCAPQTSVGGEGNMTKAPNPKVNAIVLSTGNTNGNVNINIYANGPCGKNQQQNPRNDYVNPNTTGGGNAHPQHHGNTPPQGQPPPQQQFAGNHGQRGQQRNRPFAPQNGGGHGAFNPQQNQMAPSVDTASVTSSQSGSNRKNTPNPENTLRPELVNTSSGSSRNRETDREAVLDVAGGPRFTRNGNRQPMRGKSSTPPHNQSSREVQQNNPSNGRGRGRNRKQSQSSSNQQQHGQHAQQQQQGGGNATQQRQGQNQGKGQNQNQQQQNQQIQAQSQQTRSHAANHSNRSNPSHSNGRGNGNQSGNGFNAQQGQPQGQQGPNNGQGAFGSNAANNRFNGNLNEGTRARGPTRGPRGGVNPWMSHWWNHRSEDTRKAINRLRETARWPARGPRPQRDPPTPPDVRSGGMYRGRGRGRGRFNHRGTRNFSNNGRNYNSHRGQSFGPGNHPNGQGRAFNNGNNGSNGTNSGSSGSESSFNSVQSVPHSNASTHSNHGANGSNPRGSSAHGQPNTSRNGGGGGNMKGPQRANPRFQANHSSASNQGHSQPHSTPQKHHSNHSSHSNQGNHGHRGQGTQSQNTGNAPNANSRGNGNKSKANQQGSGHFRGRRPRGNGNVNHSGGRRGNGNQSNFNNSNNGGRARNGFNPSPQNVPFQQQQLAPAPQQQQFRGPPNRGGNGKPTQNMTMGKNASFHTVNVPQPPNPKPNANPIPNPNVNVVAAAMPPPPQQQQQHLLVTSMEAAT